MASTRARRFGILTGAFAHLPLYFHDVPSIPLFDSIAWKSAARKADQATKEEECRQPIAATLTEVREALRLETQRPIRALIMLSWLTSARVGCSIQLQRRDIALNGSALKITFRRGKGVKVRGPYTVDST